MGGRGGGVEPDRGKNTEGGDADRLSQSQLRIQGTRRRACVRQADERVGSETGKDAIPGFGHQTGVRGSDVHEEVSKELDGVLVYDKLMSVLDPKLVKMQFQVSVIRLGYEAATFMKKYPGRFISLHLQDWSPAAQKEVAIGQGSVDWNKLFTAAKTGGIQNYFVEMNLDLLKASYPYLHTLKV